jgi:hypothetical protein
LWTAHTGRPGLAQVVEIFEEEIGVVFMRVNSKSARAELLLG